MAVDEEVLRLQDGWSRVDVDSYAGGEQLLAVGVLCMEHEDLVTDTADEPSEGWAPRKDSPVPAQLQDSLLHLTQDAPSPC